MKLKKGEYNANLDGVLFSKILKGKISVEEGYHKFCRNNEINENELTFEEFKVWAKGIGWRFE